MEEMLNVFSHSEKTGKEFEGLVDLNDRFCNIFSWNNFSPFSPDGSNVESTCCEILA